MLDKQTIITMCEGSCVFVNSLAMEAYTYYEVQRVDMIFSCQEMDQVLYLVPSCRLVLCIAGAEGYM